MLYIEFYFMRFILRTALYLIALGSASVYADQTMIKEFSFELTKDVSSPLKIASAIHRHAAENYGAYFLVRNSESYNGGYNERIKIKRPLDVTIINYDVTDTTVNTVVKMDYSALSETIDNYKEHLKAIERAENNNKNVFNASCKTIYINIIETYILSTELNNDTRISLVGGEDNLRLLESGNLRALMKNLGCDKSFGANFSI